MKRSLDRRLPSAWEAADFDFLKDKALLVTGGTGSFGQRFTDVILRHSKVRKLLIFSRDELKQSEMAARYPDRRVRFFIGDIRDSDRLHRAFSGVDFVVHAAALKQVPTLEYNPFEAVLTNIVGAENVINAAIENGVRRVVALSTDKAVSPINLYGATKLCAEKLFVAGNHYAGTRETWFGAVRYGNVIGSRGSIVPLFLEKRNEGVLPLTDARMTRFWITLEQGIRMVLLALRDMQRGDILVPKIPSMKIVDLARAIAPECRLKTIGIRPGEKLHEALLTEDEAPHSYDRGSHYIVRPQFAFWKHEPPVGCRPVPAGFRYASDTNDWWLSPGDLRAMIASSAAPAARA